MIRRSRKNKIHSAPLLYKKTAEQRNMPTFTYFYIHTYILLKNYIFTTFITQYVQLPIIFQTLINSSPKLSFTKFPPTLPSNLQGEHRQFSGTAEQHNKPYTYSKKPIKKPLNKSMTYHFPLIQSFPFHIKNLYKTVDIPPLIDDNTLSRRALAPTFSKTVFRLKVGRPTLTIPTSARSLCHAIPCHW